MREGRSACHPDATGAGVPVCPDAGTRAGVPAQKSLVYLQCRKYMLYGRQSGMQACPIAEERFPGGEDMEGERLGVLIAVGNQKGGVGKTTNTVHLAAALGERGYRCLILDLDPTAGATKH